MKSMPRLMTATAALALSCLALPAIAADNGVLAKVGSAEITENELAIATDELGQQFGQLPPEQQRLAVLSALIDIEALAQEAEKAKLQDDPKVKAKIKLLRDRALHNAYFEKNGLNAISDEELKARYDKEVAAMPATDEIHARHILVKTKEEAEDIIKQLDGGADFAKLATEKSTGPTGPKGGDLGFFGQGQMVPEFEKAAFALEPGSYTKEPVQTQFGWHVIKVEEKRKQQPPAFDEVKDQVKQVVLRDKYMAMIEKARGDLKVTYVDPKLKSQVEDLEKKAAAGAAADPAQATPGK
ncbi:peptidylprolyl isomerase [Consotaella salsifontis]|uniref:Parvulin-like PPIase n=1 Tax=Consotaella salsifontis TaxID=1365950 RepID=A0A1T4QM31_9HYPH|nr:peptidylprolyl isomerase [Consotaella salsifontis]SKA04755.1 peptidyl-prolyl cis-trans isomerase C [Consotaella salsifontis]